MIDDLKRFQSIETEYRGVVFRSKAEATLARNFDLLNVLWRYEPKEFTQSDGWIPDFLIVRPSDPKPDFNQNGVFVSSLIEYKPSEPTNTYAERLARRFLECSKTKPTIDEFLLLVGSGYSARVDNHRAVHQWLEFFTDPETGKDQPVWDSWEEPSILDRLIDAGRYRFDLKGAA